MRNWLFAHETSMGLPVLIGYIDGDISEYIPLIKKVRAIIVVGMAIELPYPILVSSGPEDSFLRYTIVPDFETLNIKIDALRLVSVDDLRRIM